MIKLLNEYLNNANSCLKTSEIAVNTIGMMSDMDMRDLLVKAVLYARMAKDLANVIGLEIEEVTYKDMFMGQPITYTRYIIKA